MEDHLRLYNQQMGLVVSAQAAVDEAKDCLADAAAEDKDFREAKKQLKPLHWRKIQLIMARQLETYG
mgnify:CR=1 FL=1